MRKTRDWKRGARKCTKQGTEKGGRASAQNKGLEKGGAQVRKTREREIMGAKHFLEMSDISRGRVRGSITIRPQLEKA